MLASTPAPVDIEVALCNLADHLDIIFKHLDHLEKHLITLESKPSPPTTAPTPSTAPTSQGGCAPKKARAPRKAKSTAPTIPSAMAVLSVTICTTTTLPDTLEKIIVTVSIPDDLAGHIIGCEGTELCWNTSVNEHESCESWRGQTSHSVKQLFKSMFGPRR